ncbi:NmrA family NAD(P)-binding protein [Streptomyces sp. CWNU-1]|uniref:NmrA family NAD(P)-binding protein n=2 Tax=Streptomyces albipurpureus TaxID=2897419 RepID=A0ABT0UFL8_9ACTN|nr:NmrA family NAD(P)-binding protein [Streptomyces sp. CWNU-1]
MIVIMGASGTTGGALLRSLAASGVPSRALTRDPDRLRAHLGDTAGDLVEVMPADAADTASLRAAFKGARQLFLAMANSPTQVELETRVVDTAADSGIEHIVKISDPVAAADSPVALSRGHHAVEEHLRASGLTHTVLRPYAFMQNLLLLAPAVATQGIILGAMRDAPCNWIDCRDIADVAAAALTRADLAGGTYVLTGSEAVGYGGLAEILTRLLGRPVRYLDLAPHELRENLIHHAHMPPWLANHVVEIQQLAVSHPESPTDAVARILGRDPRTLDAFLHEHLGRFS